MIKQIEGRLASIEENHLISTSCLLDPIFTNIHFKDNLACVKSINLLIPYIISSPENDNDSSVESTCDFWRHHKILAWTKKLDFTMNDLYKLLQTTFH